jgi:hypothetical protein
MKIGAGEVSERKEGQGFRTGTIQYRGAETRITYEGTSTCHSKARTQQRGNYIAV